MENKQEGGVEGKEETRRGKKFTRTSHGVSWAIDIEIKEESLTFQRWPQTVHSQKVVIGSSAERVWAWL